MDELKVFFSLDRGKEKAELATDDNIHFFLTLADGHSCTSYGFSKDELETVYNSIAEVLGK
jgi:hypothetical protein